MDIANETQALLNEQAAKVVTGNGAEFKVHYWDVVPRHYNNPVHKHSFFEICYVLEGEGEYSENGIDYPLRAGTHFCSRPGIEHQIRSQDGMYLIYVAFEPDERSSRREAVETFRSLASSGETCVYDDGSLPSSLLWKSLMLREDGRNRLSPNALQAATGALLLSFPSLFSSETPAPARFTGSADVLLRQAKLYIRDNLSRDLSLREIAAYLNVSERHLSRLFSGGIRENFTNYVRGERVRRAAELLAESDLAIKEIAEATGFSSVHYFTRVFLREKKLPPGHFRRKYGGAEHD
ncbi:helix-turn-helix domain-containing protein [Cohnella phaseoli]|uniref:AraC family L-rhamnose operon transcriptional activator RhaR n=1 Tax=Cohnella phaseoli TaxID=456490 RepID=A0A3D9HR25_9BACL|nr:helix-turn-helix domain-containing protein [Cohnella phaseoli]RED51953.1 AraC family L-rhamnose operon transcriptional activator RhaR [Cohnella phaseoli]